MGDARSADDRLPWLESPRAAKPVSAARRARTPLLLLLGLFCFSAIAVMAYLAGRGLTMQPTNALEEQVRAPPRVALAPPPTPTPAPQPAAPLPPPALAPTPAPTITPAPPRAAPVRASPVKPRATRPKPARKAQASSTIRRRAAVRPTHGVTVHRNRRPTAPRRYRWPASFASAPSGRVVQLGAYPSGHQTKAAWLRLRRAYPHLATMPRKVVVSAPRPSRPRYYRLRIGTRSPGEARALCDRLHRIGRGCIVV